MAKLMNMKGDLRPNLQFQRHVCPVMESLSSFQIDNPEFCASCSVWAFLSCGLNASADELVPSQQWDIPTAQTSLVQRPRVYVLRWNVGQINRTGTLITQISRADPSL
jgi:hypothetical protein